MFCKEVTNGPLTVILLILTKLTKNEYANARTITMY